MNIFVLSHVTGYLPASQLSGTLNVSMNTFDPFTGTKFIPSALANATRLATELYCTSEPYASLVLPMPVRLIG